MEKLNECECPLCLRIKEKYRKRRTKHGTITIKSLDGLNEYILGKYSEDPNRFNLEYTGEHFKDHEATDEGD